MIRALIVEDEDLAARRLIEMIDRLPYKIEIVGRTASIKDTIAFIKTMEFDLMFLDINLSDGFSCEIFESIGFETPPIIFTTAYSEYAIRAFELNSISYLLKPVTTESLSLALRKFKIYNEIDKNREEQNKKYKKLVDDLRNPFKKRFLVKINNRLKTINIKEISYFFSEDKLCFMLLKNRQKVPLDYSLKTLSEQLDPLQFFRINKKYLIHIDSIKEMYYTSKSKIKIELNPENPNEDEPIFIAIEKIGMFKKWLSR
ncbi:MAG: LytTR family DNA-binding domain-containing protein [Bacteroidota bacterium]